MPEPAADAILVDANLLIWAHHRLFPEHDRARAWWAATLGEVRYVGIPWPVVLAFVRISTHPRALSRPATVEQTWDVVRGWLGRPNVGTPVPTDRHAEILGDLLVRGRASGNHSSDAHLAALAIEWGLELLTADRDFARYPQLRWSDPLAARD